MRKEYVTYITRTYQYKLLMQQLKNTPFIWHNTIEIVYVLKGKINISIDTDNFELYEMNLK